MHNEWGDQGLGSCDWMGLAVTGKGEVLATLKEDD